MYLLGSSPSMIRSGRKRLHYGALMPRLWRLPTTSRVCQFCTLPQSPARSNSAIWFETVTISRRKDALPEQNVCRNPCCAIRTDCRPMCPFRNENTTFCRITLPLPKRYDRLPISRVPSTQPASAVLLRLFDLEFDMSVANVRSTRHMCSGELQLEGFM